MTRSSARNRALIIIPTMVVALVLLLASAVQAVQATGRGAEAGYGDRQGSQAAFVEYRVRSGDTLWAIADEHAAPDADLRGVVATIMDRNDLEGSLIQPGRVLLVPAEGS